LASRPTIGVVIATYGSDRWHELSWSRAYPSVAAQECAVEVCHEPDGNIATARNRGAANVKGDWLVFLDADDELHTGFVAAMQEAITGVAPKDAHERLFTPAIQYVRRGRPQEPMFWPEVDLRTGNWLVIGTAIHRSMFTALGGFREYPHGLEDFDLWSRAHKMQCRVERVPGAIYVAHWNDSSKHRQLQRQRRAYMRAYDAVVKSNWPELYEGSVA
jgi:O-antigen biosynthesis protein